MKIHAQPVSFHWVAQLNFIFIACILIGQLNESYDRKVHEKQFHRVFSGYFSLGFH